MGLEVVGMEVMVGREVVAWECLWRYFWRSASMRGRARVERAVRLGILEGFEGLGDGGHIFRALLVLGSFTGCW